MVSSPRVGLRTPNPSSGMTPPSNQVLVSNGPLSNTSPIHQFDNILKAYGNQQQNQSIINSQAPSPFGGCQQQSMSQQNSFNNSNNNAQMLGNQRLGGPGSQNSMGNMNVMPPTPTSNADNMSSSIPVPSPSPSLNSIGPMPANPPSVSSMIQSGPDPTPPPSASPSLNQSQPNQNNSNVSTTSQQNSFGPSEYFRIFSFC